MLKEGPRIVQETSVPLFQPPSSKFNPSLCVYCLSTSAMHVVRSSKPSLWIEDLHWQNVCRLSITSKNSSAAVIGIFLRNVTYNNPHAEY